MDETANLKLPFLLQEQSLKHITHNEALRTLDAVVQLSVGDKNLVAPPDPAIEGERHIVGTSAGGAWEGHDGEIAAFQNGGWLYYAPQSGWLAWVEDEAALYVFDGSAWTLSGVASVDPVERVGVNTSADATNKLAVKSDAVLFSHDDVTPGTGSMQHKLNKAAAANTASVLFQTGFSGRAEFGTTGDDDWHVKVSPDGSTWYEALIVSRFSGNIRMPYRVHVGDAGGTEYVGLNIRANQPYLQLFATLNSRSFLFNPAGGNIDSIGTPVHFNRSTANGFAIGYEADARMRIGQAAWELPALFYAGNTIFNLPNVILQAAPSQTANIMTWRNSGGTTLGAIRPDGKLSIGATASGASLSVDGVVSVKSYTVATLPSAIAGGIIFVSNETGGAVLAFSDGTNWRRSTDREIVS